MNRMGNLIFYLGVLGVILTLMNGITFSQSTVSMISFDSNPQIGIVAIIYDSQKSELVTVEKKEGKFERTLFPVQVENPSSVCIADVTGDDKPDILVKKITFTDQINSQLYFSENRGNGEWKEFTTFQFDVNEKDEQQNTTRYPIDISAGDINQDGKSDLMFVLNTQAFDTESLILYALNQGNGQFSHPEPFPIQDKKAYRLAIGDVTLDGKHDINIVTHEGWEKLANGEKIFLSQPTLKLVENLGDMRFEKSRGIIQLLNEIQLFEDISYDTTICTEEPHLVILYKSNPMYRPKDPGELVFLDSELPALKPTFIKARITWPNGNSRDYSYYVKSTPWAFYPGREKLIIKPY